MTSLIMIHLVRARLWATSRRRAAGQARAAMKDYLALGGNLTPGEGGCSVRVPPMRGIDEDMRAWSFFMILGHHILVNRSITSVVEQLARGKPLTGRALTDPRQGVMPAPDSGPEKVEEFRQSVTDHLDTVAGLGALRGTASSTHPVFGEFDAHRWHVMFAFHLKIHLKQATYVVARASAKENPRQQ